VINVGLVQDGSVQLCSRSIAIIYYLTKDWDAGAGGLLVDLQENKKYVPKFNSLVAFTVPRFHEVTLVKQDRPRFSIFGWFLEPGDIYEYNKADETNDATTEPPAGDDKGNLITNETAKGLMRPEKKRSKGASIIIKVKRSRGHKVKDVQRRKRNRKPAGEG
jgi:hypothetical protein